MSVPGSASPLFLATAAAADVAAYQIDRSLRFNSADSAYLERTPSSAGNRQAWTWSGWVKRSALTGTTARQTLFSAYTAGSNTGFLEFGFGATTPAGTADTFHCGAWTQYEESTAVFRDVSAWYHVVVSYNGTNVKAYINNEEILSWARTGDLGVNSGGKHTIGATWNGSAVRYFNGYLAEIHFLDGTSVTDATDFGEYDSNNVWQPKAFSGTYGTNGFYLKFADNSSNSALGTDSSGNDNDFTVNNITAIDYRAVFLNGNTSDLTGSPFNATYALAHLFDSDKTNRIAAAGDSTIVYTPSPAITADKFRFHYQLDSGLSGFGLKVNDVDYTSSLSSGSNQQIDINVQTLTKVEIRTDDSNQWLSLYYIEKLFEGGAGTDSLIDTPTNYTAASGNNGGNYATLNPLDVNGNSSLSNGNLFFDKTGTTGYGLAKSTIAVSSGKWYCEFTLSGAGPVVGITPASNGVGDSSYLSSVAGGVGYSSGNGYVYISSGGSSYGDTYGSGDVIGIALDLDNGKVFFSKNGTFQNSGDPAAGTNPAASSLTGTYVFGCNQGASASATAEGSWNFGQHPFAYTPPTNYVSVCTENLSESAYASIPDGSKQFDVDLWSGDNTDPRSRTLSFGPDLVWIKTRNQTNWHHLTDSVRGAPNKLYANEDNAEDTAPIYGQIDSLSSDGFTLGGGTDSTNPLSDSNQSGTNYVAWAWNAGTASAASNTDGNITSNVKVNQSAGFSIVTYSASTQASASVGHGLNAVPTFIIAKRRTVQSNWYVWFPVLDNAGKINQTLYLDTADDKTNVTEAWGHSSQMTTSTFAVHPTSGNATNNGDMVAYVFTPVEGFSAFGSFTGNGDTGGNGPFVYTGFKPRWVMWKSYSNDNEHWHILDTARDSGNLSEETLYANLNNAESTFTNAGIDILSNGFKVKGDNAGVNGTSYTYVYAAFAEHPLRHARAR